MGSASGWACRLLRPKRPERGYGRCPVLVGGQIASVVLVEGVVALVMLVEGEVAWAVLVVASMAPS